MSCCNDIGQIYPGPVVAVVDANTYSAGNLFASGFVDNRIGNLASVNLDRVDLYIDDRPHGSLKTGSRSGTRTITHEFVEPWYRVEVVGYAGDVRRQRRLLRPMGV
jgi:hypothetical protein